MMLKNNPQILNSNNSSGITLDNSNYLHRKNLPKLSNKSTLKYLNSSIFESRTMTNSNYLDTSPKKTDIYITEIQEKKKKDYKMEEVFDFKPTLTGRILPSIKKKPPTMIFCCNEKYEANNLSKLYCTYWVNPKNKKKEIPKKKNDNNIEVSNKVRSTNDYIEKTNGIILARYNYKIKKEAVERIENNVKNEMKILNNTMQEMKRCKDDLENNFTKTYNEGLTKLYTQIVDERNKSDELIFNIGKLNKEINKLHFQILKIEGIKKGIEKWIIFQIQMDKKIIPVNLKEFLKKEYNNGLIFSSVDLFMDWFENMELKNIFFINKYNEKRKEIDDVKRQYLKVKKEEDDDSNLLDNIIKEKEREYEKLKFKNDKLKKEKKEIISYDLIKKTHTKNIRIDLEGNNLEETINSKIKKIYDKINQLIGKEIDNEEIVLEILRINQKEEKILKMITSIEIALNYLINKHSEYKSNPKSYNILREMKYKIEFERKNNIASIVKLKEEKKIEELKEKINKRNKKFSYVPIRKVNNYPFFLYNKPKISYSKDNIHQEDELNLSDFLYDTK